MSHKTNDALRIITDWDQTNSRNNLDNQLELPNKSNDNTQSSRNYQRHVEKTNVVLIDKRPLLNSESEQEKEVIKNSQGQEILNNFDPKY